MLIRTQGREPLMTRFRVLWMIMLLLIGAISAWAAITPNTPQEHDLYARIRALQEEARAAMLACRGEAVQLDLQGRIRELAAKLPRDGRHALDQGGETCASATVISALPYCDSGTTTGHIDDYSPPPGCTSSSSAPDVVYAYTPTVNQLVSVSLCGSSFNTVLHIWGGCPDQGVAPVCCNDDDPFCNPVPSQTSCCRGIQMQAGTTYYIVVDGAGTSSGAYQIRVDVGPNCPSQPCGSSGCVVNCPPGATQENEPCPPGPFGTNNGQCDGHGGVYSDPIQCGQTICGTTYADSNYQDFDAYAITITQRDSLRWCVFAEFNVTITLTQHFAAG
jgi:hypothetical protein